MNPTGHCTNSGSNLLDPTGHYRVGAVTCWIQQSVSPKQVVGFSCLFNSEVDQLISKVIIVVLSSYVTPGPYFERTVRTSSKSLNNRKIARMAPILTIFGPNRSRRRDLFFEKFSNERRRHRRLVVVSSSPSSSPSSPPSSPQHNYSRSQLPRTTISLY